MNLRNILQPRYVIATTIVVLLLMLPSVVSAQRVIPHAFLGSATVNGSPAANGTVVAALVDGQQMAAKSVTGGTYPVLLVEPSGESFEGKTVTFTIGGIAAAQTFIWKQGEVTELNLTATPVMGLPAETPTPAPAPAPALVPVPKGDAGPSGQQGMQGVQGPAGPPGSGGPAGPAGSAGPAGVAGPPGSQGLTGPDGDSGVDGSSLLGILALIFAVLACLGTFGSMVWRRLVEYS